MDARGWLGLEPTHNPRRWWLPVTEGISSGYRALFGGCALGSAIAAMEEITGRPLVWATAQYLSFAPIGSVMDLDVTLAVSGHRTSQARAVGHVGGEEILTVNAALGRRDDDLDIRFPSPPAVLSPGACPPRRIDHGFASLASRLDQRWAVPADVPVEGPGPFTLGPGRVAVWTRMPDLLEPSSAALAVLGDFVPMGIGAVLDRRVSSNSLDNTIRVFEVRPTPWFLVEVTVDRIRSGFGHGSAQIWSEDGALLAVASQSAVVRQLAD
jgi:acyl-CoA thioesterase II